MCWHGNRKQNFEKKTCESNRREQWESRKKAYGNLQKGRKRERGVEKQCDEVIERKRDRQRWSPPFFMPLMPLSRLFVSLLLSKQAVTPIPHWLSKGHKYKCTNEHTRADAVSFRVCRGDGLKEGRHAHWSHCPVYGSRGTNVHFACVGFVVCVCVMEFEWGWQ